MSPARVDVIIDRSPRFGVWLWSRADFFRAYGRVIDWPTTERARALLNTIGAVETKDPSVTNGACVMMLEPREWA